MKPASFNTFTGRTGAGAGHSLEATGKASNQTFILLINNKMKKKEL